MRHDAHYVDAIARTSRSIGKTISIDQIEPNPEQPRTEFGDLSELTASIKEKGVLEPLLVVPKGSGKWMIIAGERRWRASQKAGLTEVPCIEMDLDEKGVAEIALIENLQRKDLNVWEEADGLAALAEKFDYTQEEIAKKISKSRSTVTELMTIAGIPQSLRERCKALKLNSKANLLGVARQFDEAAMVEYLDNLGNSKRVGRTSGSSSNPTPKGATAAKMSDSNDTSFTYKSEKGDFTLTLAFAESTSQVVDKQVLRALKEAFEAVRSRTV